MIKSAIVTYQCSLCLYKIKRVFMPLKDGTFEIPELYCAECDRFGKMHSLIESNDLILEEEKK